MTDTHNTTSLNGMGEMERRWIFLKYLVELLVGGGKIDQHLLKQHEISRNEKRAVMAAMWSVLDTVGILYIFMSAVDGGILNEMEWETKGVEHW